MTITNDTGPRHMSLGMQLDRKHALKLCVKYCLLVKAFKHGDCAHFSVIPVQQLFYGVDDLEFKSQQEREMLLCSKASEPTLGPSQLPIQWVLRLSPGGKGAAV
jgi:hypothetical protein